MEIKNKKAIIDKMTILMIIVILSAAVIFTFIYRANLTGQTKEQICHTSLVARSTVNLKESMLAFPVEIKCETGKICFVGSSSENCNQVFSTGENAEKIVVKTKDDLKKEISNLAYYCWNTLGAGNLQYQPKDWKWTSNYCAPCYRFAFSEKLGDDIGSGELSQDEIYTYMAQHPIPDTSSKLSYFEYLYGYGDYDALKAALIKKGYSISNTIDLKKDYQVVTVMTKDGFGKIIVGATAYAVGITAIGISAIGTGGLSVLSGVIITAKAAAVAGAIGAVAGFEVTAKDGHFTPSMILPSGKDTYEKLECKDIDFMS